MSIKDFFAEMLLGPAHSAEEKRERDEAFWPCMLVAPIVAASMFGLPYVFARCLRWWFLGVF